MILGVTSKDVADFLGIKKKSASRRLKKLADNNVIIVNKNERPYKYYTKWYEFIKDKNGNNRIKLLQDIDVQGQYIRKGEIGGIVENCNFRPDAIFWVDYTSRISNSTIRENTVIFENSIVENSEIYDSEIEESVVKDSKIVNSVVYRSNVEKNSKISYSLLSKSSVVNSTIKDNIYIHGNWNTIDKSTIKDSEIIETEVDTSNVNSISVKDSWIAGSKVYNVETENCKVFGQKIIANDSDKIYRCKFRNVYLSEEAIKNIEYAVLSHLGIWPDKNNFYVLYKLAQKRDDRYFSLYNNHFEYKVGSWMYEPNADPDITHIIDTTGFHATTIQHLHYFLSYRHKKLTVLEVKVKLKDIITVGENSIRCRRLKVIRELPELVKWVGG